MIARLVEIAIDNRLLLSANSIHFTHSKGSLFAIRLMDRIL